MPVFSAVITSKRSRRSRTSLDIPRPDSDIKKLRRKLSEAAVYRQTQQGATPLQQDTDMSTTTWQAKTNGAPNGYSTPTYNGEINGSNSPPPKADIPSGVERSFQRRRSFNSRKRDVDEIVTKHPHKVPIIIERARKEKYLSLLDKSKFLVPEELTMSQLTTIIRRRLQLADTQAFYLIVNRRTMVSASMTLAEVYRTDKDADGFLYIVYASQEMFG